MTRLNRPKPLRCAIYSRVSSDKQDVENSLDRQLRACRAWAEKNGHVAPDELVFVDEARSGASTLARPAFTRLMDLLRQGGRLPFDAVLVDDDSRLDRGGRMAEIAETFRVRSVRLISVDSGRDLTDEDERLLVHVKSGLNEHFLHELARRTRNGLASRVLHGYHAGGRVFGYRLCPEWPREVPPERRERENRLGTRVEIDPEQATVVRRIFEASARGVGQRAIAHQLNADGIRSSRGKPAWDASAIRVVLLNRKYVGDWSWNRLRFQKTPEALLTEAERERARRTGIHPRRSTKRPPEDLVSYANEGLRIVPADLWDRAQARFAERARSPAKGRDARKTRSPIAGVLQCTCGSSMFVTSSCRKGHRYTRIGCSWHRNRGPTVCTNDTTMRIEAIERPLLSFVLEELMVPDRIAQAVETFNRKLMERAKAEDPASKLQAVVARVSRLEQEQARLVAGIAKGVAYEAFAAALEKAENELRKARSEREALAAPVQPHLLPRWSPEALAARLAKFRDDFPKLDPDRLREALTRIFGRITVRPLKGSWAQGWELEMKTRPWAVLVPTVASSFGCGGRI